MLLFLAFGPYFSCSLTLLHFSPFNNHNKKALRNYCCQVDYSERKLTCCCCVDDGWLCVTTILVNSIFEGRGNSFVLYADGDEEVSDLYFVKWGLLDELSDEETADLPSPKSTSSTKY